MKLHQIYTQSFWDHPHPPQSVIADLTPLCIHQWNWKIPTCVRTDYTDMHRHVKEIISHWITIIFKERKILPVNELKDCGSGGLAPRILNLATTLWGVIFINYQLYVREEHLVFTEHEAGSAPVTVRVFRRRENPLILPGFDLWLFCCPGNRMVTILTAISCLISRRLNSRGNFWDITACITFEGQVVNW